MSRRARRLAWIVPLAIVGIVVFIAVGGTVVRLLWNWLTPALFGFPRITFWEAVGLLALCRILFGGSGGRWRGSSFRRRWDGRWEKMTPEEREKLRQGIRDCWGREPEPDTKPTA